MLCSAEGVARKDQRVFSISKRLCTICSDIFVKVRAKLRNKLRGQYERMAYALALSPDGIFVLVIQLPSVLPS